MSEHSESKSRPTARPTNATPPINVIRPSSATQPTTDRILTWVLRLYPKTYRTTTKPK